MEDSSKIRSLQREISVLQGEIEKRLIGFRDAVGDIQKIYLAIEETRMFLIEQRRFNIPYRNVSQNRSFLDQT